jgi:hypothetical protein
MIPSRGHPVHPIKRITVAPVNVRARAIAGGNAPLIRMRPRIAAIMYWWVIARSG